MSESADCLIKESSSSQCDFSRVKRRTNKAKKFKCNKCVYSTNDSCKLKRHMAVHSDERSHKCDKCEKRFKTRDDWKRHLILHSEETPFQCDECERAFPSMRILKRHKLSHIKTHPIVCKLCDHSCKYEQNMGNHFLSKHTIMDPLRCDYPGCQYTTRLERYLKRHKKRLHKLEKLFKCDICECMFHTEFNMKMHSFVHKKNEPFKCDKCQYSCRRKDELITHTVHMHFNKKEQKLYLKKHKKNVQELKKRFKCDVCELAFHKEWLFKRHSFIHTKNMPFKCDKCEYSCAGKDELKTHTVRTHVNKIKQKLYLNKPKTNTNELVKRFKCDQCEYLTKSPRYLKEHLIRRHRNISNFDSIEKSGKKCDHCGLKLRSQSDSRDHFDAHRSCYVPLPRLKLPVSRDVIINANIPFFTPLKIELKVEIVELI